MAESTFKLYSKRRRSRALLAQAGLGVLIVALLFGISYAAVRIIYGQPLLRARAAVSAASPAQPGEVPAPGPALESQPHAPSVTAAVSVQAWNTETPVERTLDADVTASDARLLAVPENGRVSDDYFRDALFIGDSVTQGFAWYPEYRDWMRVCAYKGVNPQSILQNYVGQRADGIKIEMWDEINVQQDVANIYILLGANALLQQTDEGFLKFYGELLDKLRVRFPDTPIYVQSITPTTQEYGEKKPQLEREHLKLINNAIAKLAVSKGLYYVDLWEVMADENGYLRADLAGSDGLHLLDGSKYRPWLDYLAAHQNRHALCMCIEEAMGLEIPERAKYIRTIMDELTRIASHLLFWSTFCMDLGALTAFFYGFRDREKILDMFEETCGGRLIQNYNCIGGVMADIHPNLITRIKDFIRYLPPMLKEYHGVFTGNIIARQRMKDIGILSLEDAISYGVTGPSGRASGWKCDIRKIHPYGVYDKVDFKEITYNHGDTFNRYMVRMDEIVESLHILEQLVDNIPEGDFAVKTKPIIKLPEGQYYKSVEAARGEFGVYIESHGDKFPYRVKFRSPGLPLVSVVDLLASNNKIADLIAIGGSLDYVVPDIDR